MKRLSASLMAAAIVLSSSYALAQGAPPDVLSWGEREWYKTAFSSSGEVGWVLVSRGPIVQEALGQAGVLFFSSAQRPVLLLIVRWGIRLPGILSAEAWIPLGAGEWGFSGLDTFRIPSSGGKASLLDLSSPAGEVFTAWAKALGATEDELPSVVPYVTTEERKLFWWFPNMVRTEQPPWFRSSSSFP